jgi:serine/threonine-protein kinase
MMSDSGFTTGRTLGRYEILVPIADGGMASVWAARMKGQRGFQKIVAIKQMRPELSDDPNFETMFLDEASLVSRIRHPNIAEILDLGEEDDTLYQVMEFVDGEPLNRLIRQAKGGLPVPLAVRIIKDACAGLHAAHELRDEEGTLINLVHRDVSLQNILVTYDGVTKIIDFGVAKALSNLQKTSVGQVKGKVPYMSPEQAMGDVVDRRSDVFALGIVAYQLITGKHPFRGDTDLETIMHICEKRPTPPPSTLITTIPPELDAIVLKALSKDKGTRFLTMNEMLRALEGALPADAQASCEDLGRFMQQNLGPRGEKRRQAIQDAGRALDIAAGLGSTPSPGSRSSGIRLTAGAPTSRPLSVPPPLPTSRPLSVPPPLPTSRPLSVPPPLPTSRPSSVPPPLPTSRTLSVPPPLPNVDALNRSSSHAHADRRSDKPLTIPPPPMTDRTASGLQMTPLPGAPLVPVPQAPRVSSSARTTILGLLACVGGLVVGYAALIAAEPGGGEAHAVPLAVPVLSKVAPRLRSKLPQPPPPAPTAAPQDSGTDAGSRRKKK